jgi:type I restriction enzyme S subunit
MSRGRKAKNNNGKSAIDLFKHFRSNYFYFILKELGKKKVVLTNQTSLELYEKLKDDKSKVNKDKSYSQIEPDEIPFDIPTNWNWCRLGELFQIERGSSPRPKGDPMYFSKERTNHHWIKISDISSFCKENVLLDTEEFLTDAGTQHGRYVTNKDLIVAVSGSVGKTCLLGINGYIYDGLLSVKNIDNETIKYFLFNLFKHYEKQLLEKATGAIWQNINTDIAKNQLIPLPPITEQQMILDFLNDFENGNLDEDRIYFDTEIEDKVKKLFQNQLSGNLIADELSYQLSLLKNLRQQLLQDAVQGKLVKNNETGETGQDLLNKIKAEKEQLIKAKKLKKEKELPPIKAEEIPFEIPEDWVWCRLGEIAEIGTGATPLTGNIEYYKNGTIPWVTSSATNNLFVDEVEQFITEKALKETNCTVYSKGTLVVAMYGQGKTRGQITELNIDAATNQACATITFFLKDYYLRKYIKLFFQKIYEEIRELAQGGAQPNLNMGKIRDTIIPIPPLEEQHRIVEKVTSLMQICDTLETSIQKSAQANEQLLQQVLREALQA